MLAHFVMYCLMFWIFTRLDIRRWFSYIFKIRFQLLLEIFVYLLYSFITYLIFPEYGFVFLFVIVGFNIIFRRFISNYPFFIQFHLVFYVCLHQYNESKIKICNNMYRWKHEKILQINLDLCCVGLERIIHRLEVVFEWFRELSCIVAHLKMFSINLSLCSIGLELLYID